MARENYGAGSSKWPGLRISNGSLEALKWLGLLCMTGDHINKYLFNETLPYLYELGRLTMPIFGFVLGINLARPGARDRGVYRRTLLRLAVFGAVASVPFIALGGVLHHWWPLNILWTLWAVVLIVDLAHRGMPGAIAAIVVLAVMGSCVEFWWPALFFCLAVYWYATRPSWPPAVFGVWALASLAIINGNFWALAAAPLIAIVCSLDLRLPRLRWVFYAYYPMHLAALWLIRIPMAAHGYLFFI